MTEDLQTEIEKTYGNDQVCDPGEIPKPRLKPDGTYTDDRGRIWETFSGAGKRLGIDGTTISNNMSPDATVIDGLNTVGSPAPLRLRDEIEAAVAHLIAIPGRRNVTSARIYKASGGRKYAPSTVVAEHFRIDIDPHTIPEIARRVKARILPGRDKQGTVVLYSLDDLAKDPTINALIDARDGKKIRVDANGYYTDPNGMVWATVNAFFDSLQLEIQAKTDQSSVWRQAKKHCRSQTAIDRGGRPNAEIFPVEELKTKALALVNEKMRIDKKTGYYSEKDDEGKEIMRWSTKNTWLKLLKVTKFALNKGLEKTFGTWENVPRIQGLSESKAPNWLYSEATMREILAYIFEAEIQSKNGLYVQKIIDETRGKIEIRVYRSAVALRREVNLTAENIKKRLLKAGCPTVNGIDRHSGANEELFDYDVFRGVFAEQLRVILRTDDAGDFTDETYGRCVTIQRFCEENPTISRHQLDKHLKSARHIPRLRRRSAVTNRVESMYPEKALLKSLAVKASQ